MSQISFQKRIICEVSADLMKWSAWFADTPHNAEDGPNAQVAVEQLLLSNPERRLTIGELSDDFAACRPGHLELLPREKTLCPECRGSGQYVGFTVVERCRSCRGTGSRLPLRVDVIKSDAAMRKVLRLTLRRCGFAVRRFENLEDYFEQLLVPPDCIVCGMIFPNGSGLPELLYECSCRGFEMPIVVLTEHPEVAEFFEDDVFEVLDQQHTFRDDWVDAVERAVASHRAATS